MKKSGLLEYDAFIIKNQYINDNSFKSLFEQNRKSIKDITFVKENDITNDYLANQAKIDKPHQRIFFGAPGTGKKL